MKKFYILLLLLPFFVGCGGSSTSTSNDSTNIELNTTANEALIYLNSLRKKASLIPLGENSLLEKAAFNHAKYLYENNTTGHYEDENKPFFTGYAPVDRVKYVGYLSTYVLENVSSNQADYKQSIDDLFSAIYHRLAFLNPSINNFGRGIVGKKYVYEMGNEYFNKLCENDYTGSGFYYVNVCTNGNRVKAAEYVDAMNRVKSLNSDIIIWPYKDAKDIPPVFYEEDPDPLPDYSVSGYPISIEFNDYFFPNLVTLNYIKLFKGQEEITDTKILDSDSDPNEKLTGKQFVLFPLKRLEWNTTYNVKVSYRYGDYDYVLDWNFTTKALPYPYFRIDDTNATYEIEAGKTYAYYFVPQNPNDLLGGYKVTFYKSIFSPDGKVESGFIDHNTIWAKLSGISGDKAVFEFDNGNKLTLIIK